MPQRIKPIALDRLAQHWRQYGATLATEFIVMASQIIVYKLAARLLGTIGFSEYAVVRRTVSLLQPLVLLGFGVGLPRYIAIAEGQGQVEKESCYFGATVQCVIAATTILDIVLLIEREKFAFLFFGKAVYGFLIPPLVLMLSGLAVHSVVYAYLRGRMHLGRANLLNFVNLGLMPILAFPWSAHSPLKLLLMLGIAWIIVAAIALVWTPVKGVFSECIAERKEILKYGIQRVPGDFILMALLALPSLLAAHLLNLEVAGYVAFSVSVANMIASIFTPLGIILLPKASRCFGNGEIAELREETKVIASGTAFISLCFTMLFEVLAFSVIRSYLGAEFTAAVSVFRVVVLGAVPLAIYYVLRSIVDAVYDRAVNTINLFLALIIFLPMSLLASRSVPGFPIVLWSFFISIAILALLSAREVRIIFSSDIARLAKGR